MEAFEELVDVVVFGDMAAVVVLQELIKQKLISTRLHSLVRPIKMRADHLYSLNVY